MASPISPAPWIPLLLLALSLLSAAAASPSPSKISYAVHCNSTVPESRPTGRSTNPVRSFDFQNRYIYGNIPYPYCDFNLRPLALYQTETPGTIMVEATLEFAEGVGSLIWTGREPLTKLDLSGYWSELTGKLCMVGSGYARYSGGTQRPISALLKLNYAGTSTISTAFVGGTVESLDPPHSPRHFGTVALLAYDPENYQYTLIPQAQKMSTFDLGVGGDSTLQDVDFRYMLQSGMRFELEYGVDCQKTNCNPLGAGTPWSSLPIWLDVRGVGCSADGRLHLYLEFHGASDDSYYFLPTRLIGEGIWDRHSGRASLVACRVGDFRESPLNISVQDCSIGVSFWFERFLTIESSASVVGRIWSSEGEGDHGYFQMISLRGNGTGMNHGMRYKFTKTDEIRRFCSRNNSANTRGKSYPVMLFSPDFRIRMSVIVSKEGDGRISMDPVSIGEALDDFFGTTSPLTSATNQSSWNASFYVILDHWNSSTVLNGQNIISAEGTYDSSTGVLCMVGCRPLPYSHGQSQTTDCGILINVQLAPLNPEEGDCTTGTMRSIRNTSDPLHFKPLAFASSFLDASQATETFHSNVLYASQAVETVKRMDMEIGMAIVSQTLSCFFIRQQLVHARKHPEAVPSISLLMLAILALGLLVRRNFPFTQTNFLLSGFGWLEAYEVAASISASVAFLLQFHLLRATWSARSRKEDSKDFWEAQTKSQLFCLLLYFVLNSIWMHFATSLTSFLGLMVDFFLLPQILLNLFSNSREKTLAHAYYVGTTAVVVLPHVYDACRNLLQAPRFGFSYMYASPDGDFFSTAWDMIVSVVGVLFAIIVFLQQESGGDCILPKRYRNPPAAGAKQI